MTYKIRIRHKTPNKVFPLTLRYDDSSLNLPVINVNLSDTFQIVELTGWHVIPGFIDPSKIKIEGNIIEGNKLYVISNVNISSVVETVDEDVIIDGSIRPEEKDVIIDGTVMSSNFDVVIDGTIRPEEKDVEIDGTIRPEEIDVSIDGTIISQSEKDLVVDAVPMVEWSRNYPDNLEVSSEGTEFPIVIFNDKNESVDYNLSVSNVETYNRFQPFTPMGCQINIDNYSIFLINRVRKTFNQTVGTFTISSERSEDVTFDITGIMYTEHESYVRHVIGYNAMVGRDGWAFSSVQIIPYTSNSIDMDMNFIGMADGAAEMSGNTVRYFEGGENASDVPTLERTYSCHADYKYNKDGVEQTLAFDRDLMLSNLDLTVGSTYSTLTYTILPNNSNRLRFCAIRIASNENDCLFLNTIIQESETMRLAFDKPQYYKVEYNGVPNVLGEVDLSKHGQTFEIHFTEHTSNLYEMYFWNSDVEDKITVTSFNGVNASTGSKTDNGLGGQFIRYYFYTNMAKEDNYYNDGFLITVI